MRNVSFFTLEDITLFEKVAGTKYRKANKQNIKDSIELKSIVQKMNKWIEKSCLNDFIIVHDNTWQWSGTFKTYIWIRLYKKSPINSLQPKVYYVFGLNKFGELYMELNCQRSNYSNGSNLPIEHSKIEIFDTYLNDSEYSEVEIPKKQLENYNWTKLVQETKEFILRNEVIYDEILNILDPGQIVPIINDGLVKVKSPSKISSRVPETRTYKAKDIDFAVKAKESKYLGDSGEKLVLDYEKKYLKSLGFDDLAEQVEKKKDGQGYDILSFDKKRREKYIEVKTTTGSQNYPFYLSANELEFGRENADKYIIYRIFNFSPKPKMQGEMFIWKYKDLEKATKKPLQFEVSL